MTDNNAVIIQHVYTQNGAFVDMLRLTYQRHAAYAMAHEMDYWHFIGNRVAGQSLNFYRGGWTKIQLMQKAIEAGYEHVFWIDSDAAIVNLDCDLRDALPEGAVIGAALHDPAKSPYLQSLNVPAHLNIGVLYANAGAREMLAEWVSHYGDQDLGRFLEQGVFNDMYDEGRWSISRVDDTWNATVQVNMVEKPNVIGWHGIMPYARRLAAMQQTFIHDFLTFRV